MAAHENILSISSGPLGNGCSHRRFSKRCSCGIFSLFKSHLWFKFVLKNPRKIQFFTLKNKIKIKLKTISKDVILEIRNWGQSFVDFVRIGRPGGKKSIPYFWDNIKPCSPLCQVGWKLRGCHCSSHCFNWISSLCLRFDVP